jgi:glucose-1-phosphate cytidylyltransferase
VSEIKPVMDTDLRINTGFFMFRREIFDYMRAGEELVREPFDRLIQADQLLTHAHEGFTLSMDTFKDKQRFDELYAKGKAPWEVWRNSSAIAGEIGLSPALSATGTGPFGAGVALKYGGGDFLTLVPPRTPEGATSPAQS